MAELRASALAAAPRPERGAVSHAALLLASASDTATGVGIPLALAAGLVSFLSPCVLPLVPGYLSTVIGVTPADLEEGVGVRRVLVPSLLFIASFSADLHPARPERDGDRLDAERTQTRCSSRSAAC